MLKLSHITQQFGDKVLYEDLNLQINPGEHVGLIGHNGAGKSTLIHIITGEILPDAGTVERPKRLHLGYLDQYVEVDPSLTLATFLETAFATDAAKEQRLQALYQDYSTSLDDRLLTQAGQLQNELDHSRYYERDTLIKETATGLGLDKIGLTRTVATLSGGQRSKLILAKLLLEQPDMLILDEPTNHLDDDHIAWLTQFLQDFTGTYLVVSHDRDFLNHITTHIADIEFGHLTKYTGNLKQALKQKEQNRQTYLNQYEAQKKQIEKAEAYIRKYKAGSRSTMAKSREKQLAKVERLTPPTSQTPPHLVFPYQPLVSTLALDTTDLVIGYDHPLLPPFNLTVRYGEKVALKGFNGIGKSTLIKTLLGTLPSLAGSYHFPEHTRLNYFAQELEWVSPLQTPLQYLQQEFEQTPPKLLRRQLAHAGLSGELAQAALTTLSGGEQTKVKLAHMTLIPSNFLILDEPTNHIDQEMKDNLAHSLAAFPGTVIVVSHEPDFYSPFVDRTITIDPTH